MAAPNWPWMGAALACGHFCPVLSSRADLPASAVRRIFVRCVEGFLERRARDHGVAHARAGAIVFVQRFGSALNLN